MSLFDQAAAAGLGLPQGEEGRHVVKEAGERQATHKGGVFPPSVRGILSSSWVLLGQDLWERGVTLGLDRFLEEHTEACEEETMPRGRLTGSCEQSAEGSLHFDKVGAQKRSKVGNTMAVTSQSAGFGGLQKDSGAQDVVSAMLQRTDGDAQRGLEIPPFGLIAHQSWNPQSHSEDRPLPSPVQSKALGSNLRPCTSLAGEGSLSDRLAAAVEALQKPQVTAGPKAAPSGPLLPGLQMVQAQWQGEGEHHTPGGLLSVAPRSRGAASALRMSHTLSHSMKTGPSPGYLGSDGGNLGALAPVRIAHQATTAPKRGRNVGGVPQPPKGAKETLTDGIMARLQGAVEAAESGNTALFHDLHQQLKLLAKQRGSSQQRVLHYTLQALLHRTKGTAFAVANTPSKRTFQEIDNSRMWYYTGSPVCPFGWMAVTSIILPKLRGKRSAHIIDMGQTMIPQWPALMRLLAQQSSKPGQAREAHDSDREGGGSETPDRCGGEEGGTNVGLEKLRITFLDSTCVCNPGRKDFKSVKGTARVGQVLQKVAESLGIELVFEGLELDEDNLGCMLGRVRRGEEEVCVVSLCYDLKFYSDDPCIGASGRSPRHHVLECLQRLNPDLIAFVDLDEEASGDSLMVRFKPCLDHHLALFEAHDALVSEGGRKLLHVFEDIYWGRDICSILGCDGAERRVTPGAWKTWKALLKAYGFVVTVGAKAALVSTAGEMLQAYPPGFGLLRNEGATFLAWNDTPLASASAWTPQHKTHS